MLADRRTVLSQESCDTFALRETRRFLEFMRLSQSDRIFRRGSVPGTEAADGLRPRLKPMESP